MNRIRAILKIIIEVSICFSWVIIHLQAISHLCTLELSIGRLKFGIVIMGISALTPMGYLIYRNVKHFLLNRKKNG